MAKRIYNTMWYEYLIIGLISITLSLLITFKWFSYMIGGQEYSELGSSKTSGLTYTVGQIEQSNWRFVLVALFILVALLNFYSSYKAFQDRKNNKISKKIIKTSIKDKEQAEENIRTEKEIRKQRGSFKRRF